VSLRVQLLAVGVVTLVLPLAGVRYVREVEQLLRTEFEQGLSERATRVATALVEQPAVRARLGAGARGSLPDVRCPDTGCSGEAARGIYVQTLRARPQVDGIRAALERAWSLPERNVEEHYAESAIDIGRGHSLLAGIYRDTRYGDELYLAVKVDDPSADGGRVYQSLLGDPNGDRIVLITVDAGGEPRSLLLATGAPGLFRAQTTTAPGYTMGDFNSRVDANWQEIAGGYVVEVRLPLAAFPARERLGIAVIDVDEQRDAASEPADGCTAAEGYEICVAATWNIESFDPALGSYPLPGRLVQPDPQLDRLLAPYDVAGGGRFRIVDREGWIVAQTGSAALPERAAPPASLFVDLLGMALAPNDPAQPRELTPGRAALPGVDRALAGQPDAAWYAGSADTEATVVAAVPLRDAADCGAALSAPCTTAPPFGALLLEQTSDPILTVRNVNLARLLVITLFTTVLVAAVLLGYSTHLSLRVRRLALAAESAVGPRGEISSDMPGRKARDEIGDLARSFTRLLERLREHTDYLRTLASKLSHELRTPLAVVSTSLDNLEHETQTPGGAKYVARLREGTARLDAILVAMSEATRLEQAIADMPLERYDANAVLESCVRAYRDIYPQRDIVYRSAAYDAALRGSPELLAQLLDKLVDNAVSFSPDGSRIDVELEETADELCLAVANFGPPLPATMRSRLFDSFVSVREQRGGARPHLGLGLRVVALVAEFHGGRVTADDLPGGDGVVFRVFFPRQR
jgi:signal transduction histidine kinase